MTNYGNDTTFIGVGIIDDHVSVTSAFAGLLNNMPGIKAVMQAYSGSQCLELLKTIELLPDILLMDVEMKGMNGIDATKHVTALYPTIKTIAFTGKVDDWTILQMINAGACAYMSKEMTPRQMEEAIHEVYQKGKYKADLYHLNSAELREYSKSVKDLSFTENEKRYLELLSKGYAYGQMAREIQVTVDGVDYLYRRISEKLNTKSQAVMLIEALRMGIINLYDDKKSTPKL